MNDWPDGEDAPEAFEVNLARDFDERVARVLSVPEWAEVSEPLWWILLHAPTAGALHLGGNAWATSLERDSRIVVYYAVDFEARRVTLTDIRRVDGR